MFERYWPAVAIKPFTADGTIRGEIALANAIGIKVKQEIIVASATQPTLHLEVKRVLSGTLIVVGPLGASIDARSDLSAYAVLDGATIAANFQKRPSIPLQEINRAVYEEEPTVAIRTMQVDRYGQPVGGGGGVASDVNVHDAAGVDITSTTVGLKNGLDVNVINASLDVNISALTPDSDSVRIYGVDGTGTPRWALTDAAGRLIIAPPSSSTVEADFACDPTGDGAITLTAGPDVVASRGHTTGTYNVTAWRWSVDEPCQFYLEVRDGAALVEILDTVVMSAGGADSRVFPTPIEIASAPGRVLRVTARRLLSNTKFGHASGGVNGYVD